jgi:sulfate permease, SulP family
VATATVTARQKRRSALLLGGILPIESSRVPTDVIAGATLAALAIPEVMGYTKIAGTPVITGLYTLLLPVLAFAIFGSSRHLVVGADSATAAIMATGLAGLAAAGSPQYVELASLCALMCGGLLIVARLLRLGFIANFLSRSVLVGFLTGVGIQVAMGEVGGMFGISGETGGTIAKFVETLKAIPTSTNVPTLVVSLAVLAVIVGLGRVNKAIPGALIAVVGAIVASYALDLQAQGVTVLGTVPGGLPRLSLPTDVITSANLAALLPTVVSMVVVILAQSAATSRAYAMRYGDSFDENVDLIGLGLANLGAGISGTFVVNGSPTKTEMVDSAGGRSQVSQLTAGVIVVAVLLFLTGPLAYMPNAVLAAVVFLIGLRLVDYRGMAAIARLRPGEFVVAVATAATVVVVGVEQGIILAMALSILEHTYHSYRPYDTLVVEDPSGETQLRPLGERVAAAPGLVVYRFGANLYYANASRFAEEILDIVEGADPPLRWLGLDGASIDDIDYSGADTIRQVQEELARTGVTLTVCGLGPTARAQLDAYELTPKIGADRIYGSVHDLIRAFRASPAVPAAGSPAAGSAAPPPSAAGSAASPPLAAPGPPQP